jgi:hypothetical protein
MFKKIVLLFCLSLFIGKLKLIAAPTIDSTSYIKMYETYEQYLNNDYEIFSIVKFKSFFAGNRLLKVRDSSGKIKKLIKGNYWGCQILQKLNDTITINQLFRFNREHCTPLAFQQFIDSYAIYYGFISYKKKKLFMVISKGFEQAKYWTDEFFSINNDDFRIMIKNKQERKRIKIAVDKIIPSDKIKQIIYLRYLK